MVGQLTDEELEAFTHTDKPSKQKRILKSHGIGFIEGADGKPSTTWEAINHALIHGLSASDGQPNWGAMDAA